MDDEIIKGIVRNYFYLENYTKDYLEKTSLHPSFYPCFTDKNDWSQKIFIGVCYYLTESDPERFAFVTPRSMYIMFGHYAKELYDKHCNS